MPNLAYLCLGSNIEPERCLPAGAAALRAFGIIRAVSSVLETPPLGDVHQPQYLNAVVLLETPLSARQIWDEMIPQVEALLGRVRTENKNAPRTLDIDLVLYNNDVIRSGRHAVPDADIYERDFLAHLLAEVAPRQVHPQTGESMAQIAARFPAPRFRARADVPLISNM